MPERFGRYLLLRRLAVGGMGELFLAQPADAPRGTKLLAVKTMLRSVADDPAVAMMFLDEAKLAAQLHHPNICQIYDLGREDGVLFMALEYIHGEDCDRIARALAAKNQPLPLALAARIVADAAKGLHHAHGLADAQGRPLGFIHRDISPQNLLVTFQGVVKIIDFGLARAAGRITKSQTGQLKGKFAYMSPEMVNNDPIDHRHDVFALGVVLWELCAGRRLFDADSEVGTIALVARAEVEPPSNVNPQVPPALDAICLKAVSRDREQRYQSAEEIRAALEGWLATQPARHSGAELATFLRALFAQRLETEAARGPLFGVSDKDERLLDRDGRLSDLTDPATRPGPREAPSAPAPAPRTRSAISRTQTQTQTQTEIADDEDFDTQVTREPGRKVPAAVRLANSLPAPSAPIVSPSAVANMLGDKSWWQPAAPDPEIARRARRRRQGLALLGIAVAAAATGVVLALLL